MSHRISSQDERLLDRFLDGALDGDALAACRQRLEREPELRGALQARQRSRLGFRADRDAVFAAPAGFVADVVAAARRLPVIDRTDEFAVASFCRRVLVLAAAVLVAALVFGSGLFRAGGDGRLQAAPAEVERLIQELDARHAAATEPGRK